MLTSTVVGNDADAPWGCVELTLLGFRSFQMKIIKEWIVSKIIENKL
jgi:hypothetical protein